MECNSVRKNEICREMDGAGKYDINSSLSQMWSFLLAGVTELKVGLRKRRGRC